jgi:aspartate/methionine/tyrosine aminotransferase
VSVFHTEGGWYSILQLPQARSDDEWSLLLLAEQNILVHPGHFFDIEQRSCVVLSLLPPLPLFRETTIRIRRIIEEKQVSPGRE